MPASREPAPGRDAAAARRRAVVRTAVIMAVVAAVIYVGFILSGVLVS